MSKVKKNIAWILIISAIVGGAYYFFQSRKSAIEYTTERARRGDLAQTVSVTGKINPEKEYDLSFKTSGRILSLNFDVGEKVKKKEKIGSIDAGTLYSQLAGARAEVEAQKKTLASMKDNEDIYDKNKRSAQKEIIKKAEAVVDSIYSQLRDTIIYSPIDGIVTRVNYNAGEVAMAGATVLTVAAEGDLICEANVPESDIIKIKLEQKATLTMDAFFSDDKLDAKVVEIEPAATIIQDVVYYKIKLKIERLDLRLKAGMSADVDIKTAEIKNVIIISSRAVKTENGREYVEILKRVGNNEIVEKAYVKTGLRGDEGMVEVVSGLNEGDEVVVFTKTP